MSTTSLVNAPLTLTDIVDEFLALDELSAMEEGEWTTEHVELLEELMPKAIAKVDRFGAYVRELEARQDVIAAEEERLAKRRAHLANRVAWMKRYAIGELQRLGRPKIEGELFTMALQKNPASVEVTVLPDALPDAYVRVIPERREPDKKALLEALKAGAEIPGASLAAPTFHLRIR